MKLQALTAMVLMSLLAIVPLAAQEESHAHHHAEAEILGQVHFPVTCKPEVQTGFDRAVALLHSFGYELARDAFAAVAKLDPACGMASWGVAMTYYHPIWAPPNPTELAGGRTAAEEAARLGARSEREKGYIAAVNAFYRDSDKLDHRTRALAYKAEMEKLAAAFPDDDEAAIFRALALLGTAPPTDRTYASQKQAAQILNALLPKHPDHPGILHYVIHSFDYPELASLALPAARAYSKVAASSPHALHMPSHIFTRLGLWDESIASNLASAAAAKAQVARTHPGATAFDDLHALDYLEYAYLQRGDDRKAKEVLDEVAKAQRFDEPNFAAGFSLVAVPARYALERRDWQAAAALAAPAAELPWDRYSYAKGITAFARALGAARLGDADRARKGAAELEALHAALVKQPPAGPYDWAGNVEAMRLAADGWVAFAEGRKEEAVKLLAAAADKEEAVGKHPVTPGAVLPAREQLGDLLLELGKPREALAAYETSLTGAPNRFNGLAGAARAADLAGEPAKARGFSQELLALCGPSCERAEAKQAKALMSGR